MALLPAVRIAHTLHIKVLAMALSAMPTAICQLHTTSPSSAPAWPAFAARACSPRADCASSSSTARPPSPRPVHTTGIFVRKTWEDFPLPEEQLGPPIRDVVLYSPSRRTLALRAQRDEFRVGRMSWLYLQLLEQCASAGVRWIPVGARVSLRCRDA